MVTTSPLKWYDTAIGALGAAAGEANHATNANPFGVRPYSYDTVAQSNPFGSSPFSYGSGSQGSIFGDRSQIGAISPLVNMQQQAMAHITSLLDQWQTALQPPQQQQYGGTIGSPSGEAWTNINRWDQYVQQAAAATGVPANIIKAVMRLESGGDPSAGSPAGAMGLMQIMPDGGWLGQPVDTNRAFSDPAYNILMGARELKAAYDAMGGDWDMALRAYHGFGSDGFTTDLDYLNIVKGYQRELDSAGGTPYGGYQASSPLGTLGATIGGGGGRGLDAITGGQHYDISQEFGPTDWSMGAGAYMYGYGADYGVQGHPGLDIATPRGTQLSSPVGGTVTIAGGQPYYTFYGNGAPGVGELMITTDAGDQVILGHMMQITVQPGQRVQPGQFVGYSGGENGDHYHLEVRQRGGNTPSGYTAVDPRQYLGGVNVTSYGGGAQGYPQTPQTPPYGGGAFWFMQPLNQILGGY